MLTLIQHHPIGAVAQAVLVLGLVAALGLALGKARAFGVNLGIAGVMFAGLVFGHFGIGIDEHIMEFVREFGLILFVYTVGVQVGPGFFSSLRRQGLPLNLVAALTVFLGVGITLVLHFWGNIELPVAVGLFSGATTNTPSLAAAQQALKEIPGLLPEVSVRPGLGYAMAYPFGILGIIMTMFLTKKVFRIDVQKETDAFAHLSQKSASTLSTMNIEVQNPNLQGLAIELIPSLQELGVVVSRVKRGPLIQVAQPEFPLAMGDVILAVGPKEKLEKLRVVVGKVSDVDLKSLPSNIVTRWVIVTHKEVLGHTVEELDLLGRYGVTVTRASRTEVQMPATSDFELKFADRLLLVGEEAAIKKAAKEVGNSPKQLDHPELIPVFIGLAIGVIIGTWPIHLPGVPAPVKLGLAGGPLVVALILSRIGRIGKVVWYMPNSANLMLRELGIVLFLACVGLKSGAKFLDTLLVGDGLYWMACAALITLLPLLVAAAVARLVYKINFLTICGMLAGSMTDPPALAFANASFHSEAPSISYATVYPLTMLLRVISAQAVILLFMR